MCVAVAVIAGIGVGGSIAASKISSNAAKSAAKTQVAAGDRALEFQQQQYAQARQAFDPYAQAGAAALGRLGTAATAAPTSFQRGQPMQLGQTHGMPTLPEARGGGGPVASGFQGTPISGPGGGPAPMAAPPSAPQGQPASVLMQGPDGAQRPVPSSAVASLTQRGFKVISA